MAVACYALIYLGRLYEVKECLCDTPGAHPGPHALACACD